MTLALDQLDLGSQASRAMKLQMMGLTVDGQPFDLGTYPYLLSLLDDQAPRETIIKGGQIGFTTTVLFDAALRAIEENLRGILYLFPTDNDIYDFSRARWAPNVGENPAFGQYVHSTDSASLKRIRNTPIYFRAAGAIGTSTKHSLSKLKSIPVDHLVMDESDEMQAWRKDAAEKRLDGSKEAGFWPRIISLSTPTIPGYGVDYEYRELSDCRVWKWKCRKCGGWTCLELTWPDCIAEPRGEEPFYLCSKCHEKLLRFEGESVPAHPDKSAEHRGHWISQLCKRSAADVLKAKQLADSRGRLREFFNQTLARPYAPVEDQLTKAQLDDCLTELPRSLSAEGPCCAGADPGVRGIHFWIKQRMGERDTRTLNYGHCSFDELAQLTRKFNIQVGIIDQMAETHAVRDFTTSHPEWWGGRYVKGHKLAADWDPRAQLVTMGRNETLDASHAKFLEKREHLPAPDELYHSLLVPQLTNMARIRAEDELTGQVSYRWVVLGGQKNDHLKHAHAYATVAEERVGLAKEITRARQSRHEMRRRPRSFMSA